MRELSVTCTVGQGSEVHNHDLEYRKTLKHVHDRPDGVIELIPYVDYQTRINELMRPYIDEYNAKVEKRYQEAWERYNNGEIKSKPKRKDYKKMDYDYYSAHKDDTYFDQHDQQTKPLPIFRELLVGIGDKEDRDTENVTENEAKIIFTRFVEEFRKKFPHFHLLGATVHLDESGFYHCHIDYKPITYKEMTKGLNCSISQEETLKAMKFEPEQSVINGRDKAPLRFNSFRNACYSIMDKEMRSQGIYLQYGASKIKDPEKDSSTHQNLDNFKDKKDLRRERDKIWDQSVDNARSIKHQSNIVLDIIDHGEPSAESLEKAINVGMQMQQALEDVNNSTKTLDRKGYKVSFHLFDQLKTLVADFAKVLGELCLKVKELTNRVAALERDCRAMGNENSNLRIENKDLKDRIDELTYSPAKGFVQEKLRHYNLMQYDKLLQENPEHQELISKKVEDALKEVEQDIHPQRTRSSRSDFDHIFK